MWWQNLNIQLILASGSNKLGIDTPLSICANGCSAWMSYGMKQIHAMGNVMAQLFT